MFSIILQNFCKSSFQERSYKEKPNSIQFKLSVIDMLTSSKRKSGKNVNNTLLRVLNREEHRAFENIFYGRAMDEMMPKACNEADRVQEREGEGEGRGGEGEGKGKGEGRGKGRGRGKGKGNMQGLVAGRGFP